MDADRYFRDGQKVRVLKRRRPKVQQADQEFGQVGTGGNLKFHQLRLRQYREARGLSQEALAHRAGLSLSGYRKIETGERGGVRLSTLERLAWCLNVDIKDLL